MPDYQVGDIGRSGRTVDAVVRSSKARRAEQAQDQERSFSREKFDYSRQLSEADQALQEQAHALRAAETYYGLAAKMADMQEKTDQRLEAANFLSEFKDLDHRDERFEDRWSELASKFPRALSDDAVRTATGVRLTARQTYRQAQAEGGSADYSTEAARNKYLEVVAQTNDPIKARATAKQIEQGEQDLWDARSKGLITDDDLAFSEDPAQRSPIWKPDGSLNYEQARRLAASRMGNKVAEATQSKEDSDELRFAKGLVQTFGSRADMLEGDEKQLYQSALAKLNSRSQGTVQPAASPTATAPTGPVKVTSNADYLALPSGATYIDPNGKKRQKP